MQDTHHQQELIPDPCKRKKTSFLSKTLCHISMFLIFDWQEEVNGVSCKLQLVTIVSKREILLTMEGTENEWVVLHFATTKLYLFLKKFFCI